MNRTQGWARAAVLLLVAAAAGCQLPYFLMPKEPKRKVAAEYDKLVGRNIAIVVWTDQATLDEDYMARYRIADQIRYHLSRAIKNVKFTDIRDLIDFQENSGSDWEGMKNADIGRRFKADVVLRCDVLEYTTRASDAREVRKGRVRATINVFDAKGNDADRAVFATEVAASYPTDTKTDILSSSDVDILNGTLRVFGERVAQKFSEHEVSY